MGGGRRKRKYRKNPSNKINRSPRIIIKNLEISVTDFLTDPCALPVEFRDCVLMDGTTSLNDGTGSIRMITSKSMFYVHHLDISTPHNSQVLKKIFGNIEPIERMISNKFIVDLFFVFFRIIKKIQRL